MKPKQEQVCVTLFVICIFFYSNTWLSIWNIFSFICSGVTFGACWQLKRYLHTMTTTAIATPRLLLHLRWQQRPHHMSTRRRSWHKWRALDAS
jgi:hypothetical protein